jgi:hypothetical protein
VRQGGIEQLQIAYALRAAVKGQELRMDRENHILPDPNWFAHSASLWSTSRFSRMTARAVSI